MPYKDREKQREYQKNWYQRKRNGLPTRTTPKLSKEESQCNARRIKRECSKRLRAKKKAMMVEAFGKKCFFCERTIVMIIHRKDGKKHTVLSEMSLKDLQEEIQKNKIEYVRLCGICHAGVHWAMKYLGLTWEDIVKGLK